jgi:hypothetical protein
MPIESEKEKAGELPALNFIVGARAQRSLFPRVVGKTARRIAFPHPRTDCAVPLPTTG